MESAPIKLSCFHAEAGRNTQPNMYPRCFTELFPRGCRHCIFSTAFSVLRAFLSDLVESLVDTDNDVMADLDRSGMLGDSSVARWETLVHELRGPNPSTRIEVPHLKNGIDWQAARVAKVLWTANRPAFLTPFS